MIQSNNMIFISQDIIFYAVTVLYLYLMKASPLQRHLAVNCRHDDVELLPLLTVVCSNNWSPLLLKVCASFMCWRCKAPASSQWFLLNLPLLEERGFWYTAVSSYGDYSALDSSHFVLFYKEKLVVLCSLSQQRIFPALTVAYCSSLFPPHFFIVSWRSVLICIMLNATF